MLSLANKRTESIMAIKSTIRTMPLHDKTIMRTPAGSWAQLEELAGTAVFLAFKASDFVSGETPRMDGGFAIR